MSFDEAVSEYLIKLHGGQVIPKLPVWAVLVCRRGSTKCIGLTHDVDGVVRIPSVDPLKGPLDTAHYHLQNHLGAILPFLVDHELATAGSWIVVAEPWVISIWTHADPSVIGAEIFRHIDSTREYCGQGFGWCAYVHELTFVLIGREFDRLLPARPA